MKDGLKCSLLNKVKVTDKFWNGYQELVMDTVIPYQEKILNDEIPGVEKSHALANFRIAAGLEKGEFYGMVFQDSDVAKWLEGVAYALEVRPDAELEERADKVIEIIEKAQQDDGYLNTFFTIKEPEHRWENMTQKRMYITGGIGSTVDGEAFTIDYDLPNDTVYAETCASIGLVFFARKMLDNVMDGRYADVMERALYNGIISGMQLDGKRFFYVNPLETEPGVSGKLYGHKHVLPERPGWYTCACCPPNVVRLLMSLGRYLWSETEEGVYSHIPAGTEAHFDKMDVTVESDYPWNGKVTYRVTGKTEEETILGIHIPSWVRPGSVQVRINGKVEDITADVEKGYLILKRVWETDEVELVFPMKIRKIYANLKVREDAGCVAFMRGPIVYCFEGTDNPGLLQSYHIFEDAKMEEEICKEGLLEGCVLLKIKARRLETVGDSLYSEVAPVRTLATLTAVPYYTWGNRGENQMRVWMRGE